MVVRQADSDYEQVGREVVSPSVVASDVDGRMGGCYMHIFKRKGFEDLTPINIDNKPTARKWAKKVMEVHNG